MSRTPGTFSRRFTLMVLVGFCGGCQAKSNSPAAKAASSPIWPVPAGWQHETFALYLNNPGRSGIPDLITEIYIPVV